MTPEEFQTAFNSRTTAYLADRSKDIDPRPVIVKIGGSAHSEAGHALAYGLSNLLARAHRAVAFAGDLDRPLLCTAMFGEESLRDATEGLSAKINPHIDVLDADEVDDPLITIGVGTRADLIVGCVGWCATFGEDAAVVDDCASIWGACLAACYAATACFHAMLGRPQSLEPSYSLWDYGAIGDTRGPASRPVDVGRVLQVGAGAVGSALDFWLHLVDLAGEWTIADQDEVDASNLNRQLAFIAADAGYPTGSAVNKALAVAGRVEVATASPQWYRADEGVADRDYDVVLALANEHAAREHLQERQPPVLLHATTSNDWFAQLHRHVAGLDDCINCRLPPGSTPRLLCSTGEVGKEKSVDASLPFLSGTAGLLLASELVRLGTGHYPSGKPNCTSLYMGTDAALAVQRVYRTCADGCGGWMDPETVKRMNAGNRYLGAIDQVRALNARG